MNPDMSNALAGEEMAGDLSPTEGGPDDMFGGEDPTMSEGDGLELGAGDEAELDQMFAADAQEVFPDFNDDQLLALQKLIDSRAGRAPTHAEPDADEAGGPSDMDADNEGA